MDLAERPVDADENEWKTAREKRRDGLEMIVDQLPPDLSREFDEGEIITFLEQLAEDDGPMMIGLSMGWSPAMVNRFMTGDPERTAIIDMITEAGHESVERAINQFAKQGNSTAMKLWAFNKMGHRGWADRSEVRINHQGQQELVVTVRQALEEQARAFLGEGGTDAVKALQQMGGLSVDSTIIDAEVVGES